MILSAGVIPVRKQGKAWEFLLLRCFNYWDFPKGEADAGEDLLQCGIREVVEETGLKKLEFSWGKDFYETEPYSRGKIARYYLALVQDTQEVQLLPNPENGQVEHHEFRWGTYDEALKLVNPRIKKVLDWGQRKLHGQDHHGL